MPGAPSVRNPPRICSRSRTCAARAERVVSRIANTPLVPGPSHEERGARAATRGSGWRAFQWSAKRKTTRPCCLDVGLLRQVDRVRRAIAGLVVGVIEDRLLRDDQVPSELDGAGEHAPRRHDRRHDARHRRLRAARLEAVDGLLAPRRADVGANPLGHLRRRDRPRRGLRGAEPRHEQRAGRGANERAACQPHLTCLRPRSAFRSRASRCRER